MSSAAVSRKRELEAADAMAHFSIYCLPTQFALLALAYVFCACRQEPVAAEKKVAMAAEVDRECQI